MLCRGANHRDRMRIHARALTYFDVVTRCRSIREAARQLNVASSAVNRQMLHLEEEIGAPLFERLPGGLMLTTAGELLARHVMVILQDARRTIGEIDALKGIRRGEVSVLAVESLNADLLPTVLERMLTRYPAVRISVRSAGSLAIPPVVSKGEADVGLIFTPPEAKHNLHRLGVGRFCVGAVVPPHHPLAGQPAVSFADCAQYPLILSTADLTIGLHIRRLIERHRGLIDSLVETNSIEMMKNLAARGLGVTFQSRLGLTEDLTRGRLVHIPLLTPDPVITEVGIYVRAGRALPGAVDAFIRIVSDELARREALDLALACDAERSA